MKPSEKVAMLDRLGKTLAHSKSDDVKTKYKVLTLFKELKEDISYQVPMQPIEVSDEGHKFTCPRCKTAFESEDTVDMFNGCYICLQRWRKKKGNNDDGEEEA